ncbi:MAG: hypothetical protein RIG62_10985 [Cyclobacteriaceae bacterium]
MIETNTNFLPFFFQEPVYLIPEIDSNTALNEDNSREVVESDDAVYTPLGENRQLILILVDEPGEQYLAEAHQQLLVKILQALKLTLEDISLVNVSRAPSPDAIEGGINFNICISFGMPPEPWQFSNFFRKYEVMMDETERAFLFADTLAEIGQDVEKKKQLWLNLKALFQPE